MQIVVTFNDFEEMEAFAKELLERKPANVAELNETVKNTSEIINRAEEREEAEKAAKKTGPKKPTKATGKTEETTEEPAGTPDDNVSETDVKLLLSEKLKAGKKAEVKELFGQYGVEKLSELIEKHPDKLGDFYKEAEGI